MNKQTILSLFGVALVCVGAHAQSVWTMAGKEGATEASSPSITIKAGTTYRFGAGTKWCASVTPTVDTTVRVWWADMGCADPASGVVKELDILAPPVVVPPVVLKPVKTWTCTGTLTYSLMSDGTFAVGNKGAMTCAETL